MVLCKYREVIHDSLGCGNQAGLALRAIGAIVVGVGGVKAKPVDDLSLEVLVSEVYALVNKGNRRARSSVASIPTELTLTMSKAGSATFALAGAARPTTESTATMSVMNKNEIELRIEALKATGVSNGAERTDGLRIILHENARAKKSYSDAIPLRELLGN